METKTFFYKHFSELSKDQKNQVIQEELSKKEDFLTTDLKEHFQHFFLDWHLDVEGISFDFSYGQSDHLAIEAPIELEFLENFFPEHLSIFEEFELTAVIQIRGFHSFKRCEVEVDDGYPDKSFKDEQRIHEAWNEIDEFVQNLLSDAKREGYK